MPVDASNGMDGFLDDPCPGCDGLDVGD
jgi:hypothetical protein